MQKFYIHKDDQQQGPFSLEELKELKITRETPIWYEGAESWKNANEIEELKALFKSTPPPIITESTQNTKPLAVGQNNQKKNNIPLIGTLSAVALIAIVVFYYFYQQGKQAEYKQQIEFQQKMLEEQQAQIKEQENKEAARLAEEQRRQREAELAALNNEYDEAITNLRKAKIKLEDIQQFQLLRTSSEKQQQIEKQLEVIRAREKEVDRLKNEIDGYQN